ncbi:flagellar FlbD family protein [Lederbergia panacisoli]|uniref:flagellar FlbD family protein n=1 Tax=Lederbergia panacisoli TaxID=1255251 RepID=UPI00214AAB3F|nr:flagellar FlbD family protein [Lederbergia panacisoli]MCR2820713.1 flagellar FlbD family protein [Lederbergia panacisoli]
MITITRLNGKTFQLNALYIEKIESFPDTTITLTNGRKYVAAESEEVIYRRILDFYQSINLLGRKELED